MIAHWDDVEPRRRERGPIAATWRDLGSAAGSVDVGARRIEIDPGRRSTPVHVHGAGEEIFYVLGGSGLSWQDGATFEVRAGDCLVHAAAAEAHTLRAGADGLDVLAFGRRIETEIELLPRAGVGWLWPSWVEAGADPDPWEREVAAGELEFPEPGPRPSRIVSLADAPVREREHGDTSCTARDLGRAAGSIKTGIKLFSVSPGKLGPPPHCHAAEEELFVVLEGEGTLLLGEDEHAVRPGHVVARPAGTGVAHAFRAGPGGLSFLAYGTREPNDIAYYPRSNKIYWRGVGVIGRIERLDYWDGEP